MKFTHGFSYLGVLLAFIFACALSAAVASAQTLKPKHQAAGVPCQSCHIDAPGKPAPEKACFACHGSREAIAAKTKAKYGHKNPHFGHDDSIVCSDCHREHQPSAFICGDCHDFGLKTP